MLSTIDGNHIACKRFSPFNPQTCSDHVLIFSHGNADDIGTCSSYCQWLADSTDCQVLTYDYPSYGVSDPEKTSVDSMQTSIEAVYGYCVASLNIDPANIFLVGKSLGSVPTVHLASQTYAQDIAGVVLISGLASGARVVLRKTRFSDGVMAILDRQFAPNIIKIKQVSRPVFLIHGTRDELVDIQNSHDLLQVMPECCVYSPLWVGAGHNDIESLHKGLFIGELNSFIQHCKGVVKNE